MELTDEERELVVLLRTVGWAIDRLAYDIPAGRGSPGQRREAADALTDVAELLRRTAGRVVIDGG